MAPFRADFEGQPKYDDSKPRQSRRAAAPAAGSRTLDDLERCRVFGPLIDHLVDNAPLHCHFPSQEVVALERVLDLLERWRCAEDMLTPAPGYVAAAGQRIFRRGRAEACSSATPSPTVRTYPSP